MPFALVSHPEVSCEAFSPLIYAPPAHPVTSPGDVLWALDLTFDPSVLAALDPYAFDTTLPLTGTANGGVSAWMSIPRLAGELTVTSLGALQSFARVSLELSQPPLRIGLAGEALYHDRSSLYPHGRADFERVAIDPIVDTMPPSDFERAAASMPVVFPDIGAVVWLTHANIIQSNCITTGALRWAVQYEPRFRTRPTGSVPAYQNIVGLEGHSVLVQTADGGVVRLSAEGRVEAYRYEPTGAIELLVERCGVLVSGGADVEQWWSVDDLSTTAEFGSLLSLPADNPAFRGEAVLTDCTLVAGRMRDGPLGPDGHPTGIVTELVGLDGSGGAWVSPLPDGFVWHAPMPLSDGGAVVIQGASGGHAAPLTISVVEPSGAMRWSRALDGSFGDALVERATVFMPDGVLYAVTTSGNFSDYHHRLVAIDVGAAPGPFDYARSGLNWARTSAPLPPPLPRPTVDAGPLTMADAGTDGAL